MQQLNQSRRRWSSCASSSKKTENKKKFQSSSDFRVTMFGLTVPVMLGCMWQSCPGVWPLKAALRAGLITFSDRPAAEFQVTWQPSAHLTAAAPQYQPVRPSFLFVCPHCQTLDTLSVIESNVLLFGVSQIQFDAQSRSLTARNARSAYPSNKTRTWTERGGFLLEWNVDLEALFLS